MPTFPRAMALALLVALLIAGLVSGCSGGNEPSQSSETAMSSQTTPTSQTPGASQTPVGSQTTQTSSADQVTLTTGTERFSRENWGVLASDPDAYAGARVDVVGRLLQDPVRRDDGAYWQMYADPRNYGWNTEVRYPDPSFEVAEDDFVHVTGTVKGTVKGENAYGEEVTLVDIFAETAEVVDVMAAASPADRTALVDMSIDQHGLAITLEKVEFAFDETRVFLMVANGSKQTAGLYDLQLATATQGGTIYDTETLWDYYPTVEWELLPGMDSAGIIVFPALDTSNPVKIWMEADLDDSALSFDPYVFEIPAE